MTDNRENIFKLFDQNNVRYTEHRGVHKDDLAKAIAVLIKADPENVGETNFLFNEPSVNLAMFLKLMKKNKKLIVSIGSYNLYASDANIFLVDEAKSELLYMIQFEIWPLFGRKAVTQIMLWRTQKYPEVTNLKIDSKKLTNYVFFEVLFKRFDCIVTDSQQTALGRRFWWDRIADAFAMNLPVYYINQNTREKLRIKDFEDLEAFDKKYQIWSDEHSGQGKKIAICKSAFWD